MSDPLVLPDRPADWSDRVIGPLADATLTARAACLYALARPPRWIGPAMALRNAVVAPLGLKTGSPDGGGDLLSSLPVARDTPDCFETGLIDRHLTFSVLAEITSRAETARIALTTRIWFNSLFGRIYLLAVLPGHKLVMRHFIRVLGQGADAA